MTQAQVIDLIRKNIAEAGSLRKLAKRWELSPSYICCILGGRLPPGPRVLRPLGLERVKSIVYREVAKL